jgi:hypothetical protein
LTIPFVTNRNVTIRITEQPQPQEGFLFLAQSDQDSPRQRQALLLPARQLDPALADLGVVALGQLLDERVTLSF